MCANIFKIKIIICFVRLGWYGRWAAGAQQEKDNTVSQELIDFKLLKHLQQHPYRSPRIWIHIKMMRIRNSRNCNHKKSSRERIYKTRKQRNKHFTKNSYVFLMNNFISTNRKGVNVYFSLLIGCIYFRTDHSKKNTYIFNPERSKEYFLYFMNNSVGWKSIVLRKGLTTLSEGYECLGKF